MSVNRIRSNNYSPVLSIIVVDRSFQPLTGSLESRSVDRDAVNHVLVGTEDKVKVRLKSDLVLNIGLAYLVYTNGVQYGLWVNI